MNLFIVKKLGNKEYKVYLPLLYICSIILLLIALIGLQENDWSLDSKFYSYCNDKEGCPNNYFNSLSCLDSVYADTDICTKPFLNYKESIGSKPSFIIQNIFNITIGIIGFFLFFNTFLFNKEFLKDVRLEDLK